jgi:hypothetical protein
MGISHRLKRLERQVRQLSGRDEEDARLLKSQQCQYQKLCEVLDCTSDDLSYAQYLPVWWETTHVTFWLAQAAPDEALRWLAQHHCPGVLPVLERFLQRPRFVDPFWTLQHKITPGWHSAYWHFIEVLTRACQTVWPQVAAAWPTLEYQAQSWLLQCWLLVSDPEQCQWDDKTTDEAKQADLAVVLTHLYEEYKDTVLYACHHWRPGMCYPYKGNPAYPLQPSGWGLEGPPLRGSKTTAPLDDTAAAFQHHCAHQLTMRWVAAATETAGSLDQAALLAQAQEPRAPDETSSHSSGGRAAAADAPGSAGATRAAGGGAGAGHAAAVMWRYSTASLAT